MCSKSLLFPHRFLSRFVFLDRKGANRPAIASIRLMIAFNSPQNAVSRSPPSVGTIHSSAPLLLPIPITRTRGEKTSSWPALPHILRRFFFFDPSFQRRCRLIGVKRMCAEKGRFLAAAVREGSVSDRPTPRTE